MKITCLIDSLNSGGAQRQLCLLAVELKRLGHEVEILTYYQFDFFRPFIEEHEIALKVVTSKSKIDRIRDIRKNIRDGHPDIVISFLHTPNLLAELSGLPTRNFSLIVSERDREYGGVTIKCLTRFLLHLLADVVVANSHSQADFIKKAAPWLKSRIATISNCVDLDRFHPAPTISGHHSGTTRLLVLGRFEDQKNPLLLLSAIEKLVKDDHQGRLVVDWYGNNFFINGKPTPKSSLYLQLKEEIEKRSLTEHFRLHPPEKDVVKLYQSASAVCLASLHEGCSNVICEAMSCGIPVLASRVGDNPVLVEEGKTGFLFSPDSAEDIANIISRFMSLTEEEKNEMGRHGRNRAERNLSQVEFANKYQDIFNKIKKRGFFQKVLQ